MKKLNYIKNIAVFLILLILSLPFIFAQEYSRQYDANGNLVYDSQTDIYREYNELNQLVRTRQNNLTGTILQEYIWDPIKERIFNKDEFYPNASLKSSTYYFDDDYIVLQNSSGTYNRTNIYQDGILIGYEDFDGKKRYVLPDHKGSVHLILNESGDVIEENLFSPFAEPIAGVQINKVSYEAKEYDPLTKDYDFHFRRFSVNGPPIFNQPDTLIQNAYDPQSLNRYSFERNNAYKNKDDNGHWVYIAVAAGIGAAINLGVYLYTHEHWTKEGVLAYAGSGALIGAATAAFGVAGAATASATGRELERWGEGQSLSDVEAVVDIGLAGTLSGLTAGLGAKVLPQPNSWNLKQMALASFWNKPTGLLFVGNNLAEQAFSTLINPGQNYLSNIANSYYYLNQRESLIQQVINERSSRAVFGREGGSGYSSKVGAYVTNEGHVYPTSNSNFVPNPNAERVCISGC